VPRVIAELKRASPSKGLIRHDFPVASLAGDLAGHGAAALSVLTEPDYFRGSPLYLEQAAAAVHIPVLCKDFIVDPYQILEARSLGADAVLLIAAALDRIQAAELVCCAREAGLDVLAEAHDAREIEALADAGANVIGVNSRDLKTFAVDLGGTARLLAAIPDGVIRVAESGIATSEDMRFLAAAGAHAFLVGETLMRAQRPGDRLAELLRAFGGEPGSPQGMPAPCKAGLGQ
jgi:indole-3-glycerol phosphate synthase